MVKKVDDKLIIVAKKYHQQKTKEHPEVIGLCYVTDNQCKIRSKAFVM